MFRRPLALLLTLALLLSAATVSFADGANLEALDSGSPIADSGEQSPGRESARRDEKEPGEEEPEQTPGEGQENPEAVLDSGYLDSGFLSFALDQVSLPSDLSFVIDPFEVKGQGQIYSEPILISNNSGAVVNVTLAGAHCVAAEGSGVRFLTGPVDVLADLPDKEMEIFLFRTDPGREWKLPLTGQPAEPMILVLEPGEQAALAVGGSVTPCPDEGWKSGEVQIQTAFGIEPVETLLLSLD